MTDKPMSKTAALKAAQAACGSIYRRSSTDYVCYVPFYDTKPDGPTTELQSYDYWRCRAARTRRVASIALALMGYDRRAADDYAVEAAIEGAVHYHHETTARGIVDRVLKEVRTDGGDDARET